MLYMGNMDFLVVFLIVSNPRTNDGTRFSANLWFLKDTVTLQLAECIPSNFKHSQTTRFIGILRQPHPKIAGIRTQSVVNHIGGSGQWSRQAGNNRQVGSI